jgi:hypothetical protein
MGNHPASGRYKIQRPGPPGWGLGVGLTTLPCKKENCWEASKKFSWILWRRPWPKLGCGAKERIIIRISWNRKE